jgi:hypothetical protein
LQHKIYMAMSAIDPQVAESIYSHIHITPIYIRPTVDPTPRRPHIYTPP